MEPVTASVSSTPPWLFSNADQEIINIQSCETPQRRTAWKRESENPVPFNETTTRRRYGHQQRVRPTGTTGQSFHPFRYVFLTLSLKPFAQGQRVGSADYLQRGFSLGPGLSGRPAPPLPVRAPSPPDSCVTDRRRSLQIRKGCPCSLLSASCDPVLTQSNHDVLDRWWRKRGRHRNRLPLSLLRAQKCHLVACIDSIPSY